MLFVKLTALFTLVAFTGAFVIPEGATEGIHAVTRDTNGNDVHTAVAVAVAVAVAFADDALYESTVDHHPQAAPST
jgi:hypothetical protein